MKSGLIIRIVIITAVAVAAALLAVYFLRREAPSSETALPRAPESQPTPDQQKVLKASKRLIDKGYDLKLEGQNGEALKLFEQAYAMLSASPDAYGEATASMLDDSATIHLRMGNYPKARELYNRALSFLKTAGTSDDRLKDSIGRRLETLDALEARKIVCAEPPQPEVATPPGSAGADIPYFPTLESMYEALPKLRGELRGCIDDTMLEKPISVWMVVTGTGRIILSHTKGTLEGTPAAKCLESKLEEASLLHADALPKFNACYRNYTYPFLFNK